MKNKKITAVDYTNKREKDFNSFILILRLK